VEQQRKKEERHERLAREMDGKQYTLPMLADRHANDSRRENGEGEEGGGGEEEVGDASGCAVGRRMEYLEIASCRSKLRLINHRPAIKVISFICCSNVSQIARRLEQTLNIP
jgi:hypothetical protein